MIGQIIKSPFSAPIQESQSPRILITSLEVCCLERVYQINPNSMLVKKIFKANKSLAAQHSINTYTITRLQTALANEKKKKKERKET